MKEEFWLTDGYLIVNFEIYTLDTEQEQHLSYGNEINSQQRNQCCMWKMEGFIKNKQDSNQITFQFEIGDVLIYDAKKSVNSDYVSGGSH